MNNLFVYCETEQGVVADVSLELLSKGRKLANTLGCQLEAIVVDYNLYNIGKQIYKYGVDVIHVADDRKLAPYQTLPTQKIICDIIKQEQPQIILFGASSVGRDLAPRVASALRCGLTADCTSLEIGDYEDKKTVKEDNGELRTIVTPYKDLLYQIRPAFGGNIIATILNLQARPQMATVREGVMKKEVYDENYKGVIKPFDWKKSVTDLDFVVEIISRQIEKSKINLKAAPVIVAGGYGVGSKENFQLLHELADVLGGEVGASRAAVDAGFTEHERQIGQTGVTVRPKLYIACGISGQVQHRAGMQESAIIVSINTDENAPINAIADYVVIGDVAEVLPKMIKYYKANSK
ncbi:MAG: electron transfer flavoprotein subunit alpha/FixB family protein [Bacteroidales bacterium]|jgi:electron transfer flavoprotein alpha subunit|nr:electron transfer flavoprotein subunit alpha/FixB family protein [Bacteroidales bacterium]